MTFEDNIVMAADSALVDTLGLFEGAEIALSEFKKINFPFAAKYAMESALKTLSRLSVTEKQLREKLAAKHIQCEAIDDAAEKLKGYHYLNDERYAADFVAGAVNMNRSRRETADKLRQRGISAPIIEKAMEEYSEADEMRITAEYIAKQNTLLMEYPPQTRKIKLSERAARYGFPRDYVRTVIEEVLTDESEDAYDAYFIKKITKKLIKLKQQNCENLRMRLFSAFIPMGARSELIDQIIDEYQNTEDV